MDNKKTLDELGFHFGKFLLDEGATYSSIILSKNNQVLHSYSTNKVWDGLYHETGYSKSCHLIEATKILSSAQKSFTLFWDAVLPNNEVSLYLNSKRKEKDICHGVSFCTINKNGVLEIVTMAGRFCDLNFSNQVIQHKEKIRKNLLALEEKYLTKAS